MSNGIDFVIGGKDQAKPAMSAVEKSLQRLEQKTESVSKSTQRLAAITGTLTAVYAAVKTAMAAQPVLIQKVLLPRSGIQGGTYPSKESAERAIGCVQDLVGATLFL